MRHILLVLFLILPPVIFLVSADATESTRSFQMAANHALRSGEESAAETRAAGFLNIAKKAPNGENSTLGARNGSYTVMYANAVSVSASQQRAVNADRLPEPATMVGVGAVLLAVAALARRRFHRT